MKTYRTTLILTDGTVATLDHAGDSGELAHDHGRHVAHAEQARHVSTYRIRNDEARELGAIIRKD